mmetsp:Transcript_90140/g.162578  ORF Transcript_90140/g.162578 Transcript_90140/m.162578 type:complete len:371 (+) Transcript_90140:63-1175(+)
MTVQAAGARSADVNFVFGGRCRSASPQASKLMGVLPSSTQEVGWSATAIRRQFPNASQLACSKDIAPRSAPQIRPERPRGLQDRPTTSPAYTKPASCPSVLAPWLGDVKPSAVQGRFGSSKFATILQTSCPSAAPSSPCERADARRATMVFGWQTNEIFCRKGLGSCSPLQNAGKGSSMQRSASLPPERFRFEESAQSVAAREGARGRHRADKQVGSAGLQSRTGVQRTFGSIQEQCIEGDRMKPHLSRKNVSRMSFHDLRSQIADSVKSESLEKERQQYRSKQFGQCSNAKAKEFAEPGADAGCNDLRAVLPAHLKLLKNLSRPTDPDSVPTSAGVSRHTSCVSVSSSKLMDTECAEDVVVVTLPEVDF